MYLVFVKAGSRSGVSPAYASLHKGPLSAFTPLLPAHLEPANRAVLPRLCSAAQAASLTACCPSAPPTVSQLQMLVRQWVHGLKDTMGL